MFYCLNKLNGKRTNGVNEGMYIEMSLLYICIFEIYMKDIERLTFEKSAVSIGLIESLDMPVCIQESLGHCMLCVLFCIVT